MKKNWLQENVFSSSTKEGNIDDDDGKKSDGHIRFKDYLRCEKI